MGFFLELTEAGSFNRAAKKLFISQQGLNSSISALEERLGVSLVTRTHTGISLTEEGCIFQYHARVIMEEYRRMLGSLAAHRAKQVSESEESIEMITTPYLSAIGFQNIWESCPADVAGIREEPLNRILNDLALPDGNRDRVLYAADLFLKTQQKLAHDGRFGFMPLFETRVGVLRSRTFPLACGPTIACAAVAELPVAFTNDSTNQGLTANLFKNTPLKNACLQTANVATLIEWVQANRAVSLFDSYAYYVLRKQMGADADDLVFTPFSDEEAIDTVGYLYEKGAPPSQAHVAFMELSKLLFERENGDYLRRYPLDYDKRAF